MCDRQVNHAAWFVKFDQLFFNAVTLGGNFPRLDFIRDIAFIRL
jgi:hypothetical protein